MTDKTVVSSPSSQSTAAAGTSRRVQHQFSNKLPDLTSAESDLMNLLHDFRNTKLKKYTTSEMHDVLFTKMDAVRDKQERIAKTHFEQDSRLTESKIEGEEQKAQQMRNLEELIRQLEDLNGSIHDLQTSFQTEEKS